MKNFKKEFRSLLGIAVLSLTTVSPVWAKAICSATVKDAVTGKVASQNLLLGEKGGDLTMSGFLFRATYVAERVSTGATATFLVMEVEPSSEQAGTKVTTRVKVNLPYAGLPIEATQESDAAQATLSCKDYQFPAYPDGCYI